MSGIVIAFLLLLAAPSLAFAQVNYDEIRRDRDSQEKSLAGLIVNLDVDIRLSDWFIHEQEDTFIRETRRYVVGHGEQGALFIVASCDFAAILFRNSLEIFDDGQVESIWDNGDIAEFQFENNDSRLVTTEADWLRRLATPIANCGYA